MEKTEGIGETKIEKKDNLVYSKKIKIHYNGEEDTIEETVIMNNSSFDSKTDEIKLIAFSNSNSDSSYVVIQWCANLFYVKKDKLVHKDDLTGFGHNYMNDLIKIGRYFYFLSSSQRKIYRFDEKSSILGEIAYGHKGFECGKSMRNLLNGRALAVSSDTDIYFYSVDLFGDIRYDEKNKLYSFGYNIRDIAILGKNQEYLALINYNDPTISILKIKKLKNGEVKARKWMEFKVTTEKAGETYHGHSIAAFSDLEIIATPLIKIDNTTRNRITDSLQLFKVDLKKRKLVFKRLLRLDSLDRMVLFAFEFFGIVKGKLIMAGMPLRPTDGVLTIWSFAFDLETKELYEFSDYKKNFRCNQNIYKFVHNSGSLSSITNGGKIIKIKYT